MRTSAPDVYAIGECCEIDGQTFGPVAPCMTQADILAARLVGDTAAPFALTDNGVRLKVTGVELFSLGRATVQEDDVVWSSRSANPSLSSVTDPSGSAGWRAADGRLPQRGNIYRFTGNGCARSRGLAVRSFHYATAGCRTERYDKTYSGGGWARYGRPSFSKTALTAICISSIRSLSLVRSAMPPMTACICRNTLAAEARRRSRWWRGVLCR